MKRRSFYKAIIRTIYRLRWRYEALTSGPLRVHVDLGRKG